MDTWMGALVIACAIYFGLCAVAAAIEKLAARFGSVEVKVNTIRVMHDDGNSPPVIVPR